MEGYFEKFSGTIAFAAPEILRGLHYKPSEAEVWALGVLLYTMVFRRAPFANSQAIMYEQLSLPTEDDPGVYDLLRRCLCKNSLLRIRLEEIPNHPFLAERRQ
jgi:protein-serine/threonine kinase